MKRQSILLLVVMLLILACSTQEALMSSPTQTTRGRCGDGVCGGPESATNCPTDCRAVGASPSAAVPLQTARPAAEVPPLYFFYAIHTHASGDHLPYDDPGMSTLNPETAENMIAAIEGIAGVLDRYGAKGTWEVVYGTASGLCEHAGEDHVFRRLQVGGHEVGAHAHKIEDVDTVFRALQVDCGITARANSGFIGQISSASPQETMSLALQASVDLGMTVGTTNLSPGGGKNPFGVLCGDQLGVGNDMWAQSGNLMFPWRPGYANRDICADDPQGSMVLVDHVSIEWLILPGEQGPPDVVSDVHFDQLRGWFDGALRYVEQERPEQVAVWGFVTHISEYAPGGRAEKPPDPEALAALNRFLAYVDTKRAEGRVVYVTADEAADLAFPNW